jgi:hypothetical protein
MDVDACSLVQNYCFREAFFICIKSHQTHSQCNCMPKKVIKVFDLFSTSHSKEHIKINLLMMHSRILSTKKCLTCHLNSNRNKSPKYIFFAGCNVRYGWLGAQFDILHKKQGPLLAPDHHFQNYCLAEFILKFQSALFILIFMQIF